MNFNFRRRILLSIYDLTKNLPYMFGMFLRCTILKKIVDKMGTNVRIMPMVSIGDGGGIIIGDNVYIGEYTIIHGSIHLKKCGGTIEIGDHTLIGPRVKFYTVNHNFKSRSVLIHNQGTVWKSIKIGKDVWIGADCIILPGVTINDGAVIGAGAVVAKSIPPYSIAVGVPARVIDKRL